MESSPHLTFDPVHDVLRYDRRPLDPIFSPKTVAVIERNLHIIDEAIRESRAALVADFEEGAGGASPGLNHPISGATPMTPRVLSSAETVPLTCVAWLKPPLGRKTPPP